ncbi:DUF4845 domain-containing protein [Pseudomonas matsuisoli]|uniref:DUF4845 domain-containing protein n=1 Tax=Pseudomonas matsuisoli TaxID=1515666 RepID=A0A917PKE5_9PSED|nr:DUF4845 domain-containing protein [Pseudomonas matsuisoli]GGJ82223.1 DUF4845 domain-containing protein [Pseudomonas matsuisoli]
MKCTKSENGLSLLGWLMALAIVAFLASTAFKMVPHYMDYMALEKIITSVQTDRVANVTTVADFYSHVSKGMQVNGIRDLNVKDILNVKVENQTFIAQLHYEKREPMIQNLDLVARFDKEFRVPIP